MHKPKDNSQYGDEIPRPWEGKKLLFKNVFTVWLTRIVLPGKLALPRETSLFILNVLYTQTYTHADTQFLYLHYTAKILENA